MLLVDATVALGVEIDSGVDKVIDATAALDVEIDNCVDTGVKVGATEDAVANSLTAVEVVI